MFAHVELSNGHSQQSPRTLESIPRARHLRQRAWILNVLGVEPVQKKDIIKMPPEHDMTMRSCILLEAESFGPTIRAGVLGHVG